MLRRLVKKLALSVEAPIVIDSTEAPAIEEALKAWPGCALVNSINLENGRQRVDAVMPIVARYGAAVIALTIDEEGMAKTAERKLARARRHPARRPAGLRSARSQRTLPQTASSP